jgi:hypothetical protein
LPATCTPPPDRHPHSVYDDVASLLTDRGWAQGVPRRGDALCFVAAIDAAVGVGAADPSTTEGAKLARVGRIGAHLRDLVGVRNLAAWSDEPERTFDDVLAVLAHASIAFPGD